MQHPQSSSNFNGALSGLRQFLATESPLKVYFKVCFLFPLKSSFCSEEFVISFCSNFFVIYKNGLTKKLRLISKFMTSQPGKQAITLHILPNIAIPKVNQTMKFGQLIRYITRNTSLKNHTQNFVAKLVPDVFLKY